MHIRKYILRSIKKITPTIPVDRITATGRR